LKVQERFRRIRAMQGFAEAQDGRPKGRTCFIPVPEGGFALRAVVVGFSLGFALIVVLRLSAIGAPSRS